MFEEDVEGFLYDDELASVVTFQDGGEPDKAIFDYPLEMTEYTRQGGQRRTLEIAVRYPRLMVPTAKMSIYREGRVLEVEGQEFDVVELKPDGTGWMEVRLTNHQGEPEVDTGSPWR